MIQDKEVARRVVAIALEASDKLNQSIAHVKEHCSQDEEAAYRFAAATAMAGILFEILNPIYQQHKDLAPQGFFD